MMFTDQAQLTQMTTDLSSSPVNYGKGLNKRWIPR